VDELLASSIAATEQIELDRERLDLVELAGDVIRRCRPEQRARITLRASGPVLGAWDRLRLDNVVEELVSNALKFGEDRPVEVRIERHGPSARIAVVDQGAGIDPVEQERIFERFERAVPVRHFGGLGLGLWLVRQYVEAHGGTVEVSSAAGRGSAFVVHLPGAELAGNDLAVADPPCAARVH
jgi:signal transduction histidine kinase